MMKEDAVTEETPRKRRTRATDTAEGAEATPAAPARKTPVRRKKTESDAAAETGADAKVVTTPDAPQGEASKPTVRKRKTAAQAESAELPLETKATAERTESIAPAAEPNEAPKSETKASTAKASKTASSKPQTVAEAPVKDASAQEATAKDVAPDAPPADASAPAAPTTSRRDRHKHRNERRSQGRKEGQEPQSGNDLDASAPQPQEGGHTGGGRRRRKRRRGGGGGQPNAQLEAQMQPVEGVLEIDDRGNGRLRNESRSLQAQDNDPEVTKQLIERLRLRPGVHVKGAALPRNGRLQLQRAEQVDGVSLEEAQNRISFMNLTSIDPVRRIRLETTAGELLTRAIDIIAPIGFGQRGLIVAPPKTGKTIILQKIAKAVLTNHPQARLMVVLIDERPEEVTDFKRSIGADVYASSSDRPAHEHLRIAELVLDRARRHVEAGEDVVVLLDSITRLARAYNKEVESSGRTMSGGVDSRALERPKRLFGAARNTEEAGSLTILGTALVDTGSRMDEVIFEEFKGTGNMEIILDRQLAERRIFPAINVNGSGTRKEEKLFSQAENEKIRKLRAYLAGLRPIEAMEKLLGRLRDFESNEEFFDAL